MNRYSIESDGPLWWWTSAAGGVTVMAAVVGVAVAPAAAGPDFREIQPPDRSVSASAPAQGRPCYMARATGWPFQPVCGIDGRTAQPHVEGVDTSQTVRRDPAREDCPEPPEPRYVGIPGVPATAIGCATVDRWWEYVPAMRAPGLV